MRCPHCGFNSFESAKFCAECGMPFEKKQKDPARYAKERKVVKLPSDASNRASKPIERPWEVAVPQRGASDEASVAKGDKGPTPRRRAQSAGSTGKIPPIKHPGSETGKIPVEERKARTAAPADGASGTGRAGARDGAKGGAPILIVDEAVATSKTNAKAETATAAFAPNPAHASKNASAKTAQSRRNAQRDTYSAQARPNGKSKSIIITIAILIIICLIALGVFLVNTNGNERTVSFDTDGGTLVGNQYILEDGKLDRPANPTRPGYVFEGWYLDADLSEKAQFPIDVTQDMTLYAKWKQETASASSEVPATITTPGTSTDGSTDAAANGGSASASSNGADQSGSSAGNGSQGASTSKPNATKPSTGGSSSSSGNLNGPGVSNGKVDIRLIASNGSALTGTVTLHDGYVIPDSSTKAYTVAELKALGLNDAELCIARNEPYARMGYSFRNPQLQAYFNARSWYHNKGWRGQLPEGSAGYVTAHNLLTIAQQSASASKWLKLKMN